MKKTLNILLVLLSISAFMVQCSDDDGDSGTTVSKIMGKITLSDGTVADGAIVSLSDQPNAANVVATSVAGTDGSYSFMGIENGTYYLNAKFDPANTNNLMKSAGAVILTGAEVEVAVEGDVTKDIAMAGSTSDGTGVISLTGGSVFDNTHSTIEFEFPYDAFNAVFKGHFATAGVDVVEFDEADPSSTEIKAWVDLTSVETGAPSGLCGHGRDGITGCIQGTFGLEIDPNDTMTVYCEDGSMHTSFPNTTGVAYDLWGDGSTTTYMKPSAIMAATGVATFMVTDVEAYGTGYMAKADFTFAGNTLEVDFYFNYLTGYEGEDRSGNGVNYNSIFGWFKFNPASIGLSSGHLGDEDVTVKLSTQFNNPI